MKKFIFFVFLTFSFFTVSSQQKIGEEVQKLQQKNTQFVPVSLLNIDTSIASTEIVKAVSNATLAKVDLRKLNKIASSDLQFIELEVPYQNQLFKIQLYQVNPFSDNFSINTDKAQNVAYEKGLYYRGIIKGNLQSVAAFNFFNGEFNGVFSSQELGNVVVGKIVKPNNQSDYIIYSDANFLVTNDFECHVTEENLLSKESTQQLNVNTNKCVNFYYEIDYNLYQSNNSSISQITNWMTSVFNNVQTLYTNDGITVALNAIYIWTSQDVYENIGTSSGDYLNKFSEYRPSINGDVGMLVGIDPGGLGGVAFLNSICQNYNYAYADVNGIAVSTVPTYSWTTEVITHEFGHSLGSPHTHACAWNGSNTAIDGCGAQAGYAEGNCATGPIPSSQVKGTIMSYCHLISGVGISFANGFGPQPATLITNTVNSKSCLSTDCISSCYNTISTIQTTALTNTSVTVAWVDTDTDVTSWQVSIEPFAAAVSWNTVTQPNYQASGLLPNTYYKVRIRPICTSNSVSAREYVFATTGDYCGLLSFTDTGGTQNNYTNGESFIRTITPNLPNNKIVVTFTQFSLEQDYDFLYIYNGPNDLAPEFNFGDGYTGLNSPGTVTSTAADGSLTFKFTSDSYLTTPGWTATISCQESLGILNQDFIDFAYYPNPTNDRITLKSSTTINEIQVFNVEGRLLFSQKLDLLETNVDLSRFATGTYFFKVKFGEIEKNFKVLKM